MNNRAVTLILIVLLYLYGSGGSIGAPMARMYFQDGSVNYLDELAELSKTMEPRDKKQMGEFFRELSKISDSEMVNYNALKRTYVELGKQRFDGTIGQKYPTLSETIDKALIKAWGSEGEPDPNKIRKSTEALAWAFGG